MDQATQVESDHSIILFDGVCNLCNFFVNFIINRDPSKQFKFASLQSEKASVLLEQLGYDSTSLESIVLIQKGKIYTKSRAALEVLLALGYPWKISYIFLIIPRFISDYIYEVIAANRYSWFGKRESCRVPTADISERFLDS
ncbi:MAG: putative DCC family thiol-disulfide oxidoreductase YuxK [Cyclobacteriaceae bacterium]|jgi:predicted DCC family thiol-disulfide oxidoreductase YuxK